MKSFLFRSKPPKKTHIHAGFLLKNVNAVALGHIKAINMFGRQTKVTQVGKKSRYRCQGKGGDFLGYRDAEKIRPDLDNARRGILEKAIAADLTAMA